MRIGIDVGGTNLVAGLVDENGKILGKAAAPTGANRSPEEICMDIVRVAREAAEQNHVALSAVQGIGMGIPGAISSSEGLIYHSPNIPFHDTPVRTLFQKEWDVPVHLANDASCAALGEHRAGAAKEYDSAIIVTLGTGIGGGIILNGKLFSGANEAGAEIGHMVVEAVNGWKCGCGRRGCWEAYGSATGLRRITLDEMEHDKESLMWQMTDGTFEGISGRTAFQASERGDAAGKRTVERYLHYLAVGIANLINIFQPEVICLGGGISNEKDENFLFPLRKMVDAERFTREGLQTQIIKCRLGNDAGIIGAAFLEE